MSGLAVATAGLVPSSDAGQDPFIKGLCIVTATRKAPTKPRVKAGDKNGVSGTGPVLNDFLTVFREEHREIRDTLLALYDALDKRRKKRAIDLHARLGELSGPHFRFEEEALYPSLVPIYGKVYIEHMFQEHDRAIVDALHIGTVLGVKRLSATEATRGMRLVRRILPHVSDCEGLGIMVELMTRDQIAIILSARDSAHKENLGLFEWARDARERSFHDTYQRDVQATMRQAAGVN
jgi:hypothetical protein